jgi:hypothetical protein
MAVSSRSYILEKGQVVFDGRSDSIPRDVILKYLGA